MEYLGGFPPATLCHKMSKKRWVIASFINSNEYSVIPTNWVLRTVDGDGNTVVKSVWPPPTVHVTSDILKETIEPSSDWNTIYPIRLNENGKEYNSFSKAWHKQVVLSAEESASEIDHQLHGKKTNKRFHSQMSVLPEDSDTSSEEGINIFQQNKIKNHNCLLKT